MNDSVLTSHAWVLIQNMIVVCSRNGEILAENGVGISKKYPNETKTVSEYGNSSDKEEQMTRLLIPTLLNFPPVNTRRQIDSGWTLPRNNSSNIQIDVDIGSKSFPNVHHGGLFSNLPGKSASLTFRLKAAFISLKIIVKKYSIPSRFFRNLQRIDTAIVSFRNDLLVNHEDRTEASRVFACSRFNPCNFEAKTRYYLLMEPFIEYFNVMQFSMSLYKILSFSCFGAFWFCAYCQGWLYCSYGCFWKGWNIFKFHTV